MRRALFHTFVSAILLLTATAALGHTALAEAGVLRMSLGYALQGFDPGKYSLHETSIILRHIYGTLIDYVPGEWPLLANDLCEAYEVSEDGLIYTFHLRRGIQWHRGYGELTAEDVKFSMDRILDPATGSPFRTTYNTVVESVEAVDRYTVQFTLIRSNPAFLSLMAPWRAGYVVCKAAVEEFGASYGQVAESVVGSGPFVLVEYVPGQRAILERFDGYYGTPAKVSRIEMYVIEDENTAILSLQAGEVDLCLLRVPESAPIVRADPNLNVYLAPTATTKGFVSLNVTHPALQDIRVRRALVHALDREAITEFVGGDLSVPACGFLAPYAYLGALECDELPHYAYDPDEARRLLTDAGYPRGFAITYTEINTPAHRGLAPVLQSYWAQIGVETRIELLPVTEWLTKSQNGLSETSKYTMGTRPSEPSIFLYSNLHSSSTRPGLNFMLYDGVDDLLDLAVVTTDESERLDLYRRIQYKIIEDCIMIPIFYEAQLLVTRKNVDLGAGARDGQMTSPYWGFFWLEEITVK